MNLLGQVLNPKGLMRNKVYRLNEVILFFAKAQKPRIASLFNDFCNVGKGQKNKFKYKPKLSDTSLAKYRFT